MKAKVIIGLFAIFMCVTLALAEIEIKAEVDKHKITSDETITYKLTITSFEKNISAPQIPEFKGFEIISQTESSSVSFAKTKVNLAVIYTFMLVPTDIGRFKIESAVIKIKDKIYTSDAFEIEVTPGKVKPKPKSEEKPSLPKKFLPDSEEPQITL